MMIGRMLYYHHRGTSYACRKEQFMPPRNARRQPPGRRDAAIRKHLPKAREYWSKWPAYLAEGDLCQAGEKAWGTVAQLTKAVAIHRGWHHTSHDSLREIIRQIASESPDGDEAILLGLVAAEALHGNFYELLLNHRETEVLLQRLGPLLAVLWLQLPNDYTAGVPFDEWVADHGH